MNKLFFILSISLALFSCQAQNSATPVDTEKFIELEAQEGVKVIDVRTPGEIADAYISGTDYFFNINDAKFQEQISSLDKDATYVVYCRSGARSSKAINYMVNEGFTNLYELKGGILSFQNKELLLSK